MEMRVVRFGSFELHPRSRELFKHGRKLRLQDQPFQVLAALLETPGEVVSREELRQRIWPTDTFVDFDVGLNAAVKRLRQTLGDSADSARFVETLPRLGYRFVAPVTYPSDVETVAKPTTIPAAESTLVLNPANDGKTSRWKIAAVVLMAAAAVLASAFLLRPRTPSISSPVIAVLPFRNLSPQPNTDYFSDGLTDEIISSLSMIEGLQVRSHTSSFAFKDRPRNLNDVGTQLHANLVLEGSVLRAGERLRINAQLVRVADDSTMWSARYDRDLKDVVAIQDEISTAIVTQLRLSLRAGRRRYQPLPEVYDKYLRAQALAGRIPPGPEAELRESLHLFEEVVAQDPEFAPAYAGMARLLSNMATVRRTRYADAAIQARTAAEKALRLDPLLPEAHSVVAMLQAFDLDWTQAERSYARALELDPNMVEARIDFAARVLLPLGKTEQAVSQARKALDLDPLSSEASHALLFVLYVARRFDETNQLCQQVLARNPGDVYVQHMYGRSLAQQGKLTEAIALFEKVPNAPATRRYLGYAYAKPGRRAEAERLAAEQDPAQFRQSVLIYAGLGDVERTLDALEKMAADGDPNLTFYTVVPELAFLRGNPDFAAFRRKQNLPEDPWSGQGSR